jgi:hypothetical protein
MRGFLIKVLRLKWVVFYSYDPQDKPELGFSVLGYVFGLYKGHIYRPLNISYVRPPEKWEFDAMVKE